MIQIESTILAVQSYGIDSVWLNLLMTLCDELVIPKRLEGYGYLKHTLCSQWLH